MPGGPRPETRPDPGEPGRLTVRTVPIDDPGDLLAGLPGGPLLSWVRRGRGLVGWGEAARFCSVRPGFQARATGHHIVPVAGVQ